jgi:ribosome-associated protein YbcJ (S4-like RNA binding protein)
MRIVVSGMKDYLFKSSQVITLEKVAHWVPLSERGAKALEQVIEWAVQKDGEESNDLGQRLIEEAKITVEK